MNIFGNNSNHIVFNSVACSLQGKYLRFFFYEPDFSGNPESIIGPVL